jgi:hypothetical protein
MNNWGIRWMIEQNYSGAEISTEIELLCNLFRDGYENKCKRDANAQFAEYELARDESLTPYEVCHNLHACPSTQPLRKKSMFRKPFNARRTHITFPFRAAKAIWNIPKFFRSD